MSVRLRYQTLEFSDMDVHVRSLFDNQQAPDDDTAAVAAGVPTAMWAVFGVVWDSGRALAELMLDYPVQARSVLEVGCGLGLASLVLNRRGEDITATDRHPQAGPFLAANTALNEDAPIPFVRTGWSDLDSTLGGFDLIIGSDILYDGEGGQALAQFIIRHANPTCEVVLLDPRRGEAGPFAKHLAAAGFSFARRAAAAGSRARAYKGEVLTFSR